VAAALTTALPQTVSVHIVPSAGATHAEVVFVQVALDASLTVQEKAPSFAGLMETVTGETLT